MNTMKIKRKPVPFVQKKDAPSMLAVFNVQDQAPHENEELPPIPVCSQKKETVLTKVQEQGVKTEEQTQKDSVLPSEQAAALEIPVSAESFSSVTEELKEVKQTVSDLKKQLNEVQTRKPGFTGLRVFLLCQDMKKVCINFSSITFNNSNSTGARQKEKARSSRRRKNSKDVLCSRML